jgi:hypothetical protein
VGRDTARLIPHVHPRAQVNVTLLATLLSGRANDPEVVMDCTSNIRVAVWHIIPINRRLSSKVAFGGATQNPNPGAASNASEKDKLWSARLVSSKPRMERVDSITMRNDVEVTFDRRHGMAMLLTNLKTHTDAFSVHLPELKLAVSMNVSAGPAASNATADVPPQPDADARPRAGHTERGGGLQVHDLQVGTSATVTQEHVLVDDSGHVKLTLRLEVDVRCPNLKCAPGVLHFLTDDPFTWCATGSPTSLIWGARALSPRWLRSHTEHLRQRWVAYQRKAHAARQDDGAG